MRTWLVKQVERIYRGCGRLHLVWEGRRMMPLIVSMLVHNPYKVMARIKYNAVVL